MACLSFIVAVAENGVIGNKGDLPWHLPADLKRFKARTLGKPIAMGRKTHESIGRPLPGRPNWVLTRSPEKIHPDCRVFGSIEDLVAAAESESEVMIIGGAELYKALLPHAKRLCLTVVHCAPEGDAFFPSLHGPNWRIEERNYFSADEKNKVAQTEFLLERTSGDLGPPGRFSVPAEWISHEG